jgi:hypothetical protein
MTALMCQNIPMIWGSSMQKCKCGLAWELTRHNVEVSYRGLIRCVCGRPLTAWDGFFFYTVERAKEKTSQFTSEVADPDLGVTDGSSHSSSLQGTTWETSASVLPVRRKANITTAAPTVADPTSGQIGLISCSISLSSRPWFYYSAWAPQSTGRTGRPKPQFRNFQKSRGKSENL